MIEGVISYTLTKHNPLKPASLTWNFRMHTILIVRGMAIRQTLTSVSSIIFVATPTFIFIRRCIALKIVDVGIDCAVQVDLSGFALIRRSILNVRVIFCTISIPHLIIHVYHIVGGIEVHK